MKRLAVVIVAAVVAAVAYCGPRPELEGIPGGDIQKAIQTGEY